MSAQTQQHHDERRPTDRHEPPSRPHGARRVAEWISLGLSILIVLATTAFLVHEALGPDNPVVPLSTQVLTDQSKPVEGGYEVPIEVRNDGARTVHNLQVQIAFTNASGERETIDYVIDYLGEYSSGTVYIHIDAAPDQAHIEVRPVVFRLE